MALRYAFYYDYARARDYATLVLKFLMLRHAAMPMPALLMLMPLLLITLRFRAPYAITFRCLLRHASCCHYYYYSHAATGALCCA